MVDMIGRAAAALDVPLTVGGGIADYDDAAACSTPAPTRSASTAPRCAIRRSSAAIAARLGSQSVVIAIDAARAADGWQVHARVRHRSRRDATRATWAAEAVERGAGEVLLTSIDRDGTRSGYDVELTRAVADRVRVPVIASGGAGGAADIAEVLTTGGAQAALLASLLHHEA